MAPSAVPAKRLLPSKEASLFKELLNLYETRQLKKALKTADQILKKHPDHGETLAMKGLVLTHVGRRDDGIDLVKKGVRLDLTSHICWHVFGLIQKGEKNYDEALKSYTQALRFDKENLNILRDAAHLQTQLRHYDALVDTRHALLRLRPNLRQNWIGLAVAYHLAGNLQETKKVLEHYELTLKNVPDYDVEHSEVLLYHVRVLEQLGELHDALGLLDRNAKSRAIIDRTAIMEFRARLLSKLGMEDAEHTWHALIQQNPDCHDYYKGYLSHRGIDLDNVTDENRPRALQLLRDFSAQFPRAGAPRRLALTVATGDDFTELATPYLISALEKGIPSLFADLKALYADPAKRSAIFSIVDSFRASLAPSPPSSPSPSSPSGEADPTTYLWTLYFLAQHHSHSPSPPSSPSSPSPTPSPSPSPDHPLALELLTTALTHTPTLPDLHTLKARVLKRAGDPWGAARCMDEARVLDLQDRFLNTKCGKYRLRAGLVEEAGEVFGMFTKKDAGSPAADLEDMQSLLFITEDADAQLRIGNLGMALKRYHAVQKVFNEWEDDQFDFHGYSMRKFTVNAYLDMIPWEDRLRSHPAYVHAAIAASQIYVRLHDDPSLATSASSTAHLSDAEKKAKKKAKKAAQKVQEEAKKPAATPTEDKGLEPAPAKDEDPDGLKLLQTAHPLEVAAKWLGPLVALDVGSVDVWVAVYDVAVRRKKYLQAARALSKARALDSEHPELHVRLVDFRRTVSSLPEPPPEPTGSVLTRALAKLTPEEISLQTFNAEYLQRRGRSARAVLAYAKVLRLLGTATREEVEDVVFGVVSNPEVELDIKSAQEVLAFLDSTRSPRADEFAEACDRKFELSTVFKRKPEEVAALRQSAFASVEALKGGERGDEEVVPELPVG